MSQTLPSNPGEINKIDVESLTDDQVQAFIERLDKMGLTFQDFQKMAVIRGVQPDQIRKLEQRINEYREHPGIDLSNKADRSRIRNYSDQDTKPGMAKEDLVNPIDKTRKAETAYDLFSILSPGQGTIEMKPEDMIFGMNLFKNEHIRFEPILNIPTPEDYILGAGDDLIIDVWGVAEQTYNLQVSPEGNIIIPNIGPVYVSGLRIEQAKLKLFHELGKIYAGLTGSHPNTYMSLSLNSVRSIKVNIVGEVSVPGTYTLPSLASVFNALYAAGGPSDNGSLREVDLVRNNKTISRIDLYNFLVDGTLDGNIMLHDQDVIFLRPYFERVQVKGEVKRPGIYEMKQGETLGDLITYTGGFTGKAYTRRLTIFRKTDRERKIVDVPEEKYLTAVLKDGDRVEVDSILDRYENRVEITGAVYRPGEYSLEEGMSLKDLVQKAEGFRDDAFPNRGEIFRLNPDLTVSVVPFDLSDFSSTDQPLILQREDLVLIPSITDLQEDLTVEVLGEIKRPGNYPYISNASVEDVILQAGGLLESASLSRIEVARRVRDPLALKSGNAMARIFTFAVNPGLKIDREASKFQLEPFDQVFVRRSPGYEQQKIVILEGEVQFPGKYSLSTKDEKISDLIDRAGGLTAEAYPKGARLVRKLTEEDKTKKERLDELAMMANDTASIQLDAQDHNESAIGIDLERILENHDSKYDIILKDGDKLIVPKELQTVRLNGAVLYNTTIRYDENYGFGKYISSAGGFAENAKKSKAYVIYPNGSVDRTRKVLFFNNYPSVEPGSEIYVPVKPEKNKVSPQQAISISSAIASMALVLVTLIGRL